MADEDEECDMVAMFRRAHALLHLAYLNPVDEAAVDILTRALLDVINNAHAGSDTKLLALYEVLCSGVDTIEEQVAERRRAAKLPLNPTVH